MDLKPLAVKVEALKQANMINFKERGECVLVEAHRILLAFDERLTVLERRAAALENKINMLEVC